MTVVIDAHNHLGGPDKGDGMSQSADDIISRMDAAGIHKAVVFPFNDEDPGISFSRSNDQVYSDVAGNPDRLIGFHWSSVKEFDRVGMYYFPKDQ